MKMPLVVSLAGLAMGFALPTFAQQTNTPDPELRQQLEAVIEKHADESTRTMPPPPRSSRRPRFW